MCAEPLESMWFGAQTLLKKSGQDVAKTQILFPLSEKYEPI